MGDEEFRLPGSSYDELVKIIRGYGHFNSEVALPQIATVAGVHVTIVSRNNAFLVSVGIVEGGQRKVITEPGRALALALDHNMPEDVARNWREIASRNEFFQKLLAAIRIRRGMDESALQAHVAYSAGQKKSPGVMAGSAAIVEIMKIAALVREENGKLVAAEDLPKITAGEATSVTDHVQAVLTNVAPAPLAPVRPTGVANVNVTIQLNIQCNPDQIEEVSTKLRDLIARVTEPGNPEK